MKNLVHTSKVRAISEEDLIVAVDALCEIDAGRKVLKAIYELAVKGEFRKLDLAYQPLAVGLILAMSNDGPFAGSTPGLIQKALFASKTFRP